MDEIPLLVLSLSAAGGAIVALGQSLIQRRTRGKPDEGLLGYELDAILEELEVELKRFDPKAPPESSAAKKEARAILKVFGRDMLEEARRIARRVNAESPSKDHVRTAADRIGILRSRTGALSDLALAVGSLLMGVGISYQINVWTGGEANAELAFWMVGAFAIGVGLLVGAAVNKWRGR